MARYLNRDHDLLAFSELEGLAVEHDPEIFAFSVIAPKIVDLQLFENVGAFHGNAGLIVVDFFVGGDETNSGLITGHGALLSLGNPRCC